MSKISMLKQLLFALLVFPVSVFCADTSTEAIQWLEKMAVAMKTLSYEGTFVYVRDNQIESLRIIHSKDESGEQERLFSLNGAAREILRVNDKLTCILPDARAVLVEKSRPKQYIPPALLTITSKLGRYYEFMMLGEDRVADRSAQIIAVYPKDPYRYGYRLWLDKETGMLLKSDLVNTKGLVLEQVMFTRMEILEHIPASHLKPAISGKDFKWFEAANQRLSLSSKEPSKDEQFIRKSGWKVAHVPGGFTMSMQKKHTLPSNRMPVEHMVFTDGLSSVSVFIEKSHEANEVFEGVSHMGAVHAYGTMVAGHQITVVGEVPKAAVMIIGDSVQYHPQ